MHLREPPSYPPPPASPAQASGQRGNRRVPSPALILGVSCNMQDAKTKSKIVLVICNGTVLLETTEYDEAWAFCAGMKNKNAEIFKAKRVPVRSLFAFGTLHCQ